MKTKTTFCALALLAITFASYASAEVRNVVSHMTTVQRLSESSQTIVVGKLDRVENIQLAEAGIDAARWPRIKDATYQDGQNNVRREGVLKVEQVLKGTAGGELRFVSIRQLKLENYDSDLRTESAIWFITPRPEDNLLVVLGEERGAITGSDVKGAFTQAVDFVRDHLAGNAGVSRMLDTIDFQGSRLSMDCALELSWHSDKYSDMIEELRQRIVSLAQQSPKGTGERRELITCIGRYKPEGGHNALFDIVLNDSDWSTTSLGCWSLEEMDRKGAIERLVAEWPNVSSDKSKQTVIVRALGLIRPKADHDGVELRNRALEIVKGVLTAGADKNLLREGLIASRDLRPEQEHVAAIKKLIDERDSNGIGDTEVKAAIIALAAARKVVETSTGPAAIVFGKQYLEELAKADPVLEQVIKPALQFPWTMLIAGADGRGH